MYNSVRFVVFCWGLSYDF